MTRFSWGLVLAFGLAACVTAPEYTYGYGMHAVSQASEGGVWLVMDAVEFEDGQRDRMTGPRLYYCTAPSPGELGDCVLVDADPALDAAFAGRKARELAPAPPGEAPSRGDCDRKWRIVESLERQKGMEARAAELRAEAERECPR